ELRGSTVEGSFEVKIHTRYLHFRATDAKFHGSVRLDAPAFESLHLHNAEIQAGLFLRGIVAGDRYFNGAKLAGELDWANCSFGGDLIFPQVRFVKDSTLVLDGASVSGGLRLSGLATLPNTIRLNDATVTGETRIEAPLGTHKPVLIATERSPSFGG